MELVYRLATETSPLIKQIRDNVIVSVTPRRRSRRPRSQRRLVLSQARAAGAPAAARRAGAQPAATRRRGAAPAAAVAADAAATARAVLGQVRLPRQQPRHQPLADVDARDRRLVLHRASADHARPARVAAAALHLQRRARRRIPNLDPILFAELPFFSNFELAQMTKWGMPGVYTHAFMDGWSPGYLGSVAYNHNGMMRMYETQSGREADRRGSRPRCRSAGAACGRGGAAARRRRGRGAGGGGRGGDGAAGAAAGRRGTGRGGGAGAGRPRRGGAADRPRRRSAARVVSRHPDPAGRREQLLAPQQHELHADRRAVRPAAHRDRSRTSSSRTSIRRRRTRSSRARPSAPYGFVIPVQRDMTRVAELVNILRAQRIEVGQATAEIKIGDGDVPGRLVRDQARSAVRPAREEPAREAELSRSQPPHLRRQRLDDGAGDAGRRQGDQGQGDPRRRRRRRSTTARVKGKVTGSGHRRPRGRALRLEQHDRVPLQAAERADEDRRQELHGRRRRVPGRLVRDRAAGRSRGRARGRRASSG